MTEKENSTETKTAANDARTVGGMVLPAVGMSSSAISDGTQAPFTIASEKTNWFDRAVDRCSEWFSSIVVKEVRQALKSGFFIWPFFGAIVAILCFSFIACGAFSVNSDIHDVGPTLLCGFFDILGIPLAVIIPFAAFRSLIHEFEDGTSQLISITTLRPWQIVAGKLSSAIMQIMIYMSIFAPCIVFTTMLRGVDITAVWLMLGTALAGSVCMCIFALFLASASRHRAIGVISSLILLAALVGVYSMWCTMCYALTFEARYIRWEEPELWCIIYALFAAPITSALVLFAGSCAQLTFPTDNRTTFLRIAVFVQQIVFLGWVVSLLMSFEYMDDEALMVTTSFFVIYWLIAGTMMFSVGNELSRRQRRGLPSREIPKALFSLFMPGPGRGYLFALTNMWTGLLFFALVYSIGPLLPASFNIDFSGTRIDEAFMFLGIIGIYFTLYLTLLFLLLAPLKRFRTRSGPLFGLLIAIVFIPVILVLPVTIQYLATSSSGYSYLQMLNGFWTSLEAISGNREASISIGIVSFATILLTIIAIRMSGRELRAAVAQTPQRVIDERLAGTAGPDQLPPGESLDEIFGPLDPKPSTGDAGAGSVE